MASTRRLNDGRIRIEWYGADRRRKSISVGNLSDRNADRICDKVTELVQSVRLGLPLDDGVAKWLSKLDDKTHSKLAKAGLCEARVGRSEDYQHQAQTLGEFLDDYIAKRTDVKKATLTVYGHVRRNLIDCFGADKPLLELTPGDGDEFVRFLKREELAATTVNRRLSLARTAFTTAVRERLISQNPFADVRAGTRSNPTRQRFISQEVIADVIDQAPDAEFRLLIALSRFGGLRIPSEALSLRWDDVDWDRMRIRVPSPKTEHHEGKASRLIPLFPELAGYLQEAAEQAEPGTEFVISRHRPACLQQDNGHWEGVNFRTRLTKMIRRAGHEPWPKLWHNLRASRETELTHEFPLHVVTEWLGNTEAVAAKHYLQVTDSDFERAAAPQDEKRRYERRCTASHRARTFSQPENGDRRNSRNIKEKRPHEQTCDRSDWRIGDLNP